MKDSNTPSPLAGTDEDVARLFDSLEDDGPSPEARTELLSRLEAAESGSDRTATSLASKGVSLRTLALVGGVLLTTGVLVTAARRTAGPGEGDARVPNVSTAVEKPYAQPAVVTQREAPATTASPEKGPSTANVPSTESAPIAMPSVSVDRLPNSGAPSSAPNGKAASNVLPSANGAAENKDSFREQLAIVEAARHSLSQGNASESLATLRRYDAKYPTGLFTTEVRVVRVEALMASGKTDEAHALARRLIASDPQGPYADRLRALLPKTDGLER